MNKLQVNQRSLILLILLSFIIVIFVSVIFVLMNFSVQKVNNNYLKAYSDMVEKKISKEIIKQPSRFTSFFYSKNSNVFHKLDDYRFSYNVFSKDSDILYKDTPIKISYIERTLTEKKQLPAFIDNTSGYLFYPVSYINLEKIDDINKISSELFFNRENNQVYESSTEAGKILNYIFINLNDKKIIVLLSPPYDPDPFYPSNSRKIMIITMQKKSDKNNIYYVKNVNVSNNR